MRDDHFTSLRVPGGNLVSPPQLARDGPIAQVLKPVRVDFLVRNFRKELRLVVARHQPQRQITKLAHVEKPLHRNQWLDDGLAAFALGNRELVVDDLLEQTKLSKSLNNFFPRFVTVQAGKVRSG